MVVSPARTAEVQGWGLRRTSQRPQDTQRPPAAKGGQQQGVSAHHGEAFREREQVNLGLRCRLHSGRVGGGRAGGQQSICLSCFFFPMGPKQCSAHSEVSVSICGMNECMKSPLDLGTRRQQGTLENKSYRKGGGDGSQCA